jgi:hypothetical protein
VGCGSDTSDPQQTSAPAPVSSSKPAPPGTTSTAAPAAADALNSGIVVHECKIGGDFSAILTSYDPTSGDENGSVNFTVPVPETVGELTGVSSNAYCSGTGSNSEDGRLFRTAYSEDFTKYFVGRKDENTGSNVIGYYEPNSSEFHQISVIGNEFSKTDHRYPSYHVPTGRLYFWDYSSGEPVLSSTLPMGAAAVQVEPALQERLDFHETLYTPANSKLPVMIDNQSGLAESEAPAVNDAGTLAASVWDNNLTIGPTNDPIKLANNSPDLPFTDHPPFKFGPQLKASAFVDDDSIIFTDQQRIFRADAQGGQAVVTTLVDNVNEDTTIFNITLSDDKRSIAFMSRQGTTTKLYVKPLDAGAPTMVHSFDKEVRIVQFRK